MPTPSAPDPTSLHGSAASAGIGSATTLNPAEPSHPANAPSQNVSAPIGEKKQEKKATWDVNSSESKGGIRGWMQRNLHLSWPWLVLAVYCSIYLLKSNITSLDDGDTYLHIAVGQWVWEHGIVPRTDVFSYTMAGQPWVAHEWLAGLGMAGLYALWGLPGLYAALVFCGGVALALQMRFLLRHLPVAYALALLVLAGMAMHTHLLARPHAYAWPLMVWWFTLLWQAAESQRVPTVASLPLMTVWANLHGGYVLGLALVLPCALLSLFNAPNELRRSLALRWAAFGLAALAAACINPDGWRSLAFVHAVTNMAAMRLHISEWRPVLDYTLGAWTLALLGMAFAGGLRMNPVRLACVLVLWGQAYESARFIAVLGLLAPFVLAQPLAEVYQRHQAQMAMAPQVEHWLNRARRPASFGGVLVLSMALVGVTWWARLSNRVQPAPRVSPTAALHAIDQHGRHGRGLNAQVFGGYLILHRIPVYIDGRIDMYGDRYLLDFIDLVSVKAPELVEATLQRWQIEWALLTPTTRIALYLQLHPQWQTLYQDDYSIALIRRPATGAKAGAPATSPPASPTSTATAAQPNAPSAARVSL